MSNINDDIVCLLLPYLNSCFHEIMNSYREIISYHYLFSKIGCVIPLFLYLINRFEL